MIHHTAQISGDALLEDGAIIAEYAVIGTRNGAGDDSAPPRVASNAYIGPHDERV